MYPKNITPGAILINIPLLYNFFKFQILVRQILQTILNPDLYLNKIIEFVTVFETIRWKCFLFDIAFQVFGTGITC